jgi:hypothetical protein
MDLDGCIFGWLLFGGIDIPIAYHTGIIVSWCQDVPTQSIIAHYGTGTDMSKVYVERLIDGMKRSNISNVKVNPRYRATFSMNPYTIDSKDQIHMSDELMQYELNHPQYDVISCNCQHFVKHFIGDLPLESDMFQNTKDICRDILYTSIVGSKKSIHTLLSNIASDYHTHRSQGVCAWDETLDINI